MNENEEEKVGGEERWGVKVGKEIQEIKDDGQTVLHFYASQLSVVRGRPGFRKYFVFWSFKPSVFLIEVSLRYKVCVVFILKAVYDFIFNFISSMIEGDIYLGGFRYLVQFFCCIFIGVFFFCDKSKCFVLYSL